MIRLLAAIPFVVVGEVAAEVTSLCDLAAERLLSLNIKEVGGSCRERI